MGKKYMRHSFIFTASFHKLLHLAPQNRRQIYSTVLTSPKTRHPWTSPTLLHLSGRHFPEQMPPKENWGGSEHKPNKLPEPVPLPGLWCATPVSTIMLEIYFVKFDWFVIANKHLLCIRIISILLKLHIFLRFSAKILCSNMFFY